jgi:hypothetical protein
MTQEQSNPGDEDASSKIAGELAAAAAQLAAALAKIRRLQMLPGPPGKAALDAFETADAVRRAGRVSAKTILSKNPSAIPGWGIGLSGSRKRKGGPKRIDGQMLVKAHRRTVCLRLIQKKGRRR